MADVKSTSSYLDPPQLIGRPNADGTISITPLELKRLNDYNYAVAKMIQGGLNLANLNKATNDVFTGMVTFTDLSDPTKSTVINGDHITTGTISANRVSGGTLEGVVVKSYNAGSTSQVKLDDGNVILLTQGDMVVGDLYFDANESKIILKSDWGMPLKIVSAANLSIDAAIGSKVYIGTSASASGNVDIGKTGGTVNLIGTILNNGNTFGAAVFT